jgi:hypothetical protein
LPAIKVIQIVMIESRAGRYVLTVSIILRLPLRCGRRWI